MNESISGPVRVRFAPSPTGPLHMGGVRTALYNYLFARKNKGTNYLRIEDTDQVRFVPGAEKYIIEALTWCGINYDEGPHIGGPYGPYRQSERMKIYEKYTQQLLSDGKAYYAFDTPGDLDAARAKTEHFQYDANTRGAMKNSLALPKAEVDALLRDNVPHVVRIKYPDRPINITVNDIVRGVVTMNTSLLDDKVLVKGDGLPTYHLANVVDDHLMKTTHVLRGEEWLPSVPLHVFLYKSFGWEAPDFAHLALILKPEGSGKLSKRDGAKFGFPVFPLDWKDPFKEGGDAPGFRDSGYLPEGFVNLLALLGWNPGTDKEIFTMDELINIFSLERLNKAGARFNPTKAKWFNAQHIRAAEPARLAELVAEDVRKRGHKVNEADLEKMVESVKGRVSLLTEIWSEIACYFEAPEKYEEKAVEAKWRSESPTWMTQFADTIEDTPWDAQSIQGAFQKFVEDGGLNFSFVSTDLRLVITGSGGGPNVFDVMVYVGKEESLRRMRENKVPVSKKSVSTDVKPAAPAGGGANKQEVEHLEREIDKIRGALDGCRKKLANPSFAERAPADVVEKEKQKRVAAVQTISDLESRMREFGIKD